MIFVEASLLISVKVGYGWRDQEVTLREEKVSEERAERPTKPLMKFRPSRTKLSEASKKRGLGNAPVPERFAEEANYLRPLIKKSFLPERASSVIFA